MKTNAASTSGPTEPRSPSGVALAVMAAGILAAEASALALLGWQDWQAGNRAARAAFEQEIAVAAAQFSDRAAAVSSVLALSQQARGEADTSDVFPEAERVVALRPAAQSAPGGRDRAAAEAILALGQTTDRIALSDKGDVVVVIDAAGAASMLAYGPAERWLQGLASNAAATLTTAPNPSEITIEGRRRLTVCEPLGFTALHLCAAGERPVVSDADRIRAGVYLLIVLATGFALLGFYRLLRRGDKERRAARQSEADAAHFFDLVMEGANAGSWEWSPTENRVTVSDQFALMLGLAEGGDHAHEEVCKRFAYGDCDRLRSAMERSRTTGRVDNTFRTETPDGVKWIEIRGCETADSTEEVPHHAGIATDVSDRIEAEERLKSAERRLHLAIESFSGPLAIWDKRRRLLYWNRAYATAFNLDGALQVGRGYDTIVAARAGAIRREQISKTEDGVQFVQLTSGVWLKLLDRRTPDGGLITLGMDVSETVKSNEELRREREKLKILVRKLEISEQRAEAMAQKYAEEKARAEYAATTKSAFLANMSHELRTPLNAVNGFSEILASELYGPLGDARYKGYAKDILMSGQHLLDMINDILDMAKIEAGKMSINPQPIDPVDPVDAAIRMVRRKAEEKAIQLTLQAEPDLPDIDADHRAVRQMVLNLVSNAIKFTGENGRIAVAVRRKGDSIRISVSDNGVGISEEDLPRLARPFEQIKDASDVHQEGTGLGLALTKSFAEMHGGRLAMASQKGKGTTAAIYLPIGQCDAVPKLDVA